MKHKLIKLIAIILTITFLWQEVGLAEFYSLRPVAVRERGADLGALQEPFPNARLIGLN